VAAACHGDEALRVEVEALLKHAERADKFLVTSIGKVAAAFLTDHSGSLVGRPLGVYQIQSLIAVGGMGEVYRARDTKLRRDVAIKVLPHDVMRDPDRLARFKREAQVLASLNHPNIAGIHGLEESDGTIALVLELVEGPTLADRIAHGPIPVDEALSIARQIAEALESAHDRAIVHRDLKPANIKLRPDGTVKVLDFGLAKAIESPSSLSSDVSQSPTITAPVRTHAGMIVGTAAYMSPEQARGQRVDAQTDIWAFGCVLYEMLSGRAAFGRATLTDTMAAVIESEPDWTALTRSTPASIVRLLRRTLEKNPSRRLHAIADARLDLDETPEPTMPPAAATSSRRSARSLMLGAAVVALVVGAGGLLLVHRDGPLPSQTPTRLSIATPGQVTAQFSVAVSPDGRRLAYVSTDASGGSRLWVRDLNALAPHALAGTEDAAHPFWAPDGSAIGFVAAGKLKRVDAGGGQVLTLADPALRRGATWSSTGVILFAPRAGEFATVPATGGPVSTALKVQVGVWPSFLSDGRHFLFHAAGDADGPGGVYVGSLGSQTTKLVLPGDFGAVFAPPDYLISSRGEGLVFAQHFDLTRLEVTGEPVSVAEGVWSRRPNARLSVSATSGVLAYINASLANTELAWFDRSGRPIGTVGAPGPNQGQGPRIAPDGTYVAIAHGDAEASTGDGIWVTRLADGTTRRLTLEPGALEPIWSSDSSRILFELARGANDAAVSIQDARSNATARSVGALAGRLWDWSPDGQRIVIGRGTPMDLWLQSVDAGGDPVLFARSGSNKTQAHVSPDGRWIAYTSLDTGHDEVFVDSFPIAGHHRQVSVSGGMMPRWRRDGSELFYLTPDQMLMAMPVTTKSGYFDAGGATPLFRTRLVPTGSQIAGPDTMYDVTPDGQRFLVNGPPSDPGPPITVVLDWAAGLK
jgi:serine/threonine protein kinase/Tol biopolymer transport system component